MALPQAGAGDQGFIVAYGQMNVQPMARIWLD